MARLDPDSPLYNIAVAYRLHGPLDLAALERGRPAHRGTPRGAAGHVSRRERSSRSSSSAPRSRRCSRSRTSGRPRRRARGQDSGRWRWRRRDARSTWRGARCGASGSSDASDEEHDLVLVMHHIVSDAWSFYVFCQELAECYDAVRLGPAARLAELPIQYPEFGQRQRQWLSGRGLRGATGLLAGASGGARSPGSGCRPIAPARPRRSIGERFNR